MAWIFQEFDDHDQYPANLDSQTYDHCETLTPGSVTTLLVFACVHEKEKSACGECQNAPSFLSRIGKR